MNYMIKTLRSIFTRARIGYITQTTISVSIIAVFLLVHQPLAMAITECELDEIRAGTVYYNGCLADCEQPSDSAAPAGSSSSAPTGAANGYPLRLPAISDTTKLANAIDTFIASKTPSSPMKGMGKYFVQGGMRAGINPLLVVGHSFNESGFGTADTKYNQQGAHNSFGRTASDTQPGIDTGRRWYKWNSWEESLYAAEFPASGKTEQPDDQFQYINRRFGVSLDSGLETYLAGDTARGLPAYAPANDGNNIPSYIKAITDSSNEIAQMSGGAIDLGQLGAAAPDSGAATPQPATASAATAGTTGQAVIALDPGHGSVVAEYTDPTTGLGDRETDNSPEREDVQDVANQVKAGLEQAGYKVVMLKTNATDAVSKRERVDAAKAANANLALSIHTSSDSGTFENWGEVWPQFVNGYRQSSTDASKKVVFSNSETADKSNVYSEIITTERDKAERGGTGITKKVVGQPESFGKARGLPSFGDISLVQLWSDDIPWVYNEAGAGASGLTPDQKHAYAQGLINGVQKSIPSNLQAVADESKVGDCLTPTTGTAAVGNGNSVSAALLYAWPTYRGSKTAEARAMKPEYDAAITIARSKGYYIGGVKYPGVDCGGFVTRVMIDSGYEPGYNKGGLTSGGASATPTQLAWVRENWQSVGRGNALSTADLMPGDVAFRVTSSGSNDGHTFMYVGTQPGFGSVIASASLDGRAPVAGKESPTAANIEWFRKK